MEKIKIWLQAMRLRTLPLSLAGIILGTGIAAAEDHFNIKIFILAILTAVSYQILSNLANDYGDGIKGTDQKRSGPQRVIASGLISPEEMKKALLINIFISIVLTYFLLISAFPKPGMFFYIYFLLGLLSIWAAMKYTVGKGAYGYYGLGDLFVLIFFGWIAVAGVYFLYSQQLEKLIFLPATATGLLSVAVLNLNNMRDIKNDSEAGKKTLAVKLGHASALKYQRALILLSLLLMIYFTLEKFYSPWQWVAFIFYIPLLLHTGKLRQPEPATYNRALKNVSLLTFFFALAYAILSNLA